MVEDRTIISAEKKYSEAVSLYAESSLPIKAICERTGVGFSAFSSYLSKHQRHLILQRHNLDTLRTVKLRGKKGQTTSAHLKYKDAIAACDSMEYIEYNVSQIARLFNLDPTALGNQLRRHYPHIVPRREQQRKQMGISINLQYGARKWSKEQYAKAVEMLHSTDMTIEEVAQHCNVSHTGLREHILAYYPDLTRERERKRKEAEGQTIPGERNGTWAIHQPFAESNDKYAKALELYRTTAMDIPSICRTAGVGEGGFRHHLRTWHPHLMVQRRGYDEKESYDNTKRYRKSTAEKYAPAIERLKSTDLPTAKVAAEFGLNPEVFRVYLHEHCPELASARGMTTAANGKLVSARSAEKYAEALHLYETTAEPLITIAKRLGLTYNSLGGFIRRNYPDAIAKHKSLLAKNEITKEQGTNQGACI